jgi:twitching motility protein PilT
VFATLHTNSAIATINRLVSVFPSDQQERVRVQLSFTLQAVLSQRLLPAIGGGRVVACEFLLMTPGIRNLIREGKLHQIESMMQVGQDKSGMITINQSLVQLLLKRKISLETAFETSASADQLEKMMKHAGL